MSENRKASKVGALCARSSAGYTKGKLNRLANLVAAINWEHNRTPGETVHLHTLQAKRQVLKTVK